MPFALFVREALGAMCAPHRAALAAEPDVECDVALEPQSLAGLYAAFSLFDRRGQGRVRIAELADVLASVHCRLDDDERAELLEVMRRRLPHAPGSASPASGAALMTFHEFIALLMPPPAR